MANKGNFIDVTGVVKELNNVFKEHKTVIEQSATALKGYEATWVKMKPSDLTNAIVSSNNALSKQNEALTKLNNTTSKYISKTQEEITNTRILTSNANRQVLANSQLAGAYRNLSAQVSIASEKVQNIISRGRTAEQTQRQYNKELRTAQIEFRKLQDRVLAADKAVDKWNRTGERSVGFMKNLMSAFGIVGGVTLFAVVSKDIFETTKELQSLDKSLKLVTETQGNFAEQQMFLKNISENYGLEIKSLTKQFTQFYVSAKDKLSGTQIQNIFESVSKAASSMGLSVEQQERAFLALNQMMSKGTIQAEELRGQLGEALPGAFGIMAKAIGVTERELQDMMKAGEVLAADVLPKFANALEKAYGIENVKRIDNLAAAQTRLSNAWTDFVRSLDEDGNRLTTFLSGILNLMTETVKGWRDILTSEETARKNDLQRIRTESKQAVEDYYSDISKFNKKDLEEKKKNYEEEARIIRARYENLKNVNIQLAKTSPRSPFGQLPKETKDQIKGNEEMMKKLNTQMSIYYGNIEGLDSVLGNYNKTTSKTIELTKKQIDAMIKANREAYLERTKIENLTPKGMDDGYLKQLKEQKKAIEEIQEATSNTSQEYKNYQKVIDGLQQSIDLIEDPSKVIKGSTADFEAYAQTLKNVQEFSEKAEEELMNLFQTIADESLSNMGFDSLIPMFNGTFEKMWNTANTFNEKFAVGMKYIGDVAKQTFEFINMQQQANYDAEYNRLEQQRNDSLRFAGENISAREEIERQYEQRRRAIQRQEAKDQKKLALFNSIINTAQAVTAFLAKGQYGFALVAGILGAAQTAMIAAQEIPQFWKGTENAPEGWAYTQEKGREVITDKHGKVKSTGSDKGAQLTYLKKGDKVYTAKQTEALMFDNELNNMLLGSGISLPKVEVSMETGILANKLDALTDIVANKESIKIVRDARGERIYQKKQAETKELLNNRLEYKGYDI